MDHGRGNAACHLVARLVHSPTLSRCKGGFVFLFTIEILLKLFGFGVLFFFDNWNNVDLVVVTVSGGEIVYLLSEMAAGNPNPNPNLDLNPNS